jgi:hypothetical protein
VAKRAKTDEWSFLGTSYASDARRANEFIHELVQLLNVSETRLELARRRLAEKPHWPRDAKDIAMSVHESLRRQIQLAASYSMVSRLPRLPEHGEFARAHRLFDNFALMLGRAGAVRKAVSRATTGLDTAKIDEALIHALDTLRAPLS